MVTIFMSNKPVSDDIPPEESVIFDLSTSCTLDQAVMKMLGWGKDVVYRQVTSITENGLSPEAIRQVHPSIMTLEERLTDLSEHARIALIDAAENDASFDILTDLAEDVKEVRAQVVKARRFRMDIEEELAKGEQSILRKDKTATKSSGVTHLSIRSLERWIAEGAGAGELPPQTGPLHKVNTVTPSIGKGSKAEDSLYITLAIAVTAFAQKAHGKYLKSGVDPDKAFDTDDMNMAAIYQHLEEIASKQISGKEFPGQSVSSLKASIKKAFELKRHKVKDLI